MTKKYKGDKHDSRDRHKQRRVKWKDYLQTNQILPTPFLPTLTQSTQRQVHPFQPRQRRKLTRHHNDLKFNQLSHQSTLQLTKGHINKLPNSTRQRNLHAKPLASSLLQTNQKHSSRAISTRGQTKKSLTSFIAELLLHSEACDASTQQSKESSFGSKISPFSLVPKRYLQILFTN